MNEAPAKRLASESKSVGGRWLAVIVLVGLLLRGALLVHALRAGRLDDHDKYLPLARGLAHGHGFALDGRPTAYRPPLYPIMLAPLTAVLGERVDDGVAALHLTLGAGTIVLTWCVARRWGLGSGLSLVAAAVVAGDPVLVSQGRAVMTETLAAFLISAALAALTLPKKWGAVMGGIAFGLGALCRPSLLPAAAVTALAALWLGPGGRRDRLAWSALLVVATLATLSPWVCRNAAVFGVPIGTTTHGGYTLYLANNPVYYDEVVNGPPGAVWTGPNQNDWWDATSRSVRGLSEPQADRAQQSAAFDVIASRPRDFAWASVARLGRFWGLAPAAVVYPRWLRALTMVWTVPLWVALVAGLTSATARRWPQAAAPATLFALTLVHTFYWTDLRMRAPLVPAVALLAAAGLERFWKGGNVFPPQNQGLVMESTRPSEPPRGPGPARPIGG